MPAATQPADWGIQFQRLAADAGQISARALRRYQELLERVARGELRPDHVQQQFRDYLQEQAGSSTRDLVELSVGLLSGLLYAEARYREALLDGLLPPDAPVPPPPQPAGEDLGEWFQALATYATEQGARGMARHQQLIGRVAAGEISAAQVREQGQRYLEAHAPAFVGEVMTLGLGFVERLQRSSSSLTDGLYDRVLGPDDARTTPEPPVYLDLHGTVGSTVSATLIVENTRTDAAQVTCRVSDFAARAFGRRFTAPIEIEPPQFTLAAGDAREVTVRLMLDPSVFVPGADYVATLQISGAGERELIVQLLARGEQTDAGHAGAAAPRGTPLDETAGEARSRAAEPVAAAAAPSEPGSGKAAARTRTAGRSRRRRT